MRAHLKTEKTLSGNIPPENWKGGETSFFLSLAVEHSSTKEAWCESQGTTKTNLIFDFQSPWIIIQTCVEDYFGWNLGLF